MEKLIEDYYQRIQITPAHCEALAGMLHHEFDQLMAAETDDGYSIGFQFHPESILTPRGPLMLERCINKLFMHTTMDTEN